MNPLKIRLAKMWRENGTVKDNAIIDAFLSVPRELFILPEYAADAYSDYPLPILAGQTISQPTTVMIMTQALAPKKGDKILEVGTGSGYQAAILSKIVGTKGKIISTEIIPQLFEFARRNLTKAGIKNVELVLGDGGRGYAEQAPYDKIIVTAASLKIPPKLIEQLKEGGVMVIPVGEYSQRMLRCIKKNNTLVEESIGDFLFVPLTGESDI